MRRTIRNLSVILAVLSVVGCSREERPATTMVEPTTLETTENVGATMVPVETTEMVEKMTTAVGHTRYMTVEKAIELCEKWEESNRDAYYFQEDMKELFDAEVDTPAEIVGSGLLSYKYFCGPEKTDAIYIRSDRVWAGEESDSESCVEIYQLKTIETSPAEDVCNISEEQNLYASSYKKATDEQKKQLDALKEKYGVHVAHYIKEIKMIMGELPEGTTGGVTLEQVKELFEGFSYDELIVAEEAGKTWDDTLCEKMNSITGAPDYVDLHGLGDYRYYVEGENGNYVRVWSGAVDYISAVGEEQLSWIFPKE